MIRLAATLTLWFLLMLMIVVSVVLAIRYKNRDSLRCPQCGNYAEDLLEFRTHPERCPMRQWHNPEQKKVP